MNLHEQLDDLAGEMTGTNLADLRRRVERTSRQLRARRTAAALGVAVAVVAALTGGAAVLRIQDKDHRPDVVPETSGTPSPSPSRSQPFSKPPSAASGIPGELSFLTLKAGKPIELRRYVDGSPQTVRFGTATSKDVYATPSPDGTRLAINTSPNPSQITPGDLVVVSSGGARRTIAHDVEWTGGSTVVWAPDGTTLIAGGVAYDAATGASRPFRDGPQYLAYSPDGATIAYVHPTQAQSVKVSKVDGGSARAVSVAGLEECELTAGCPTSVQAVSDDGRYLALGNVNSDPQHVYQTALVYDTVARKRLALGEFQYAWFRADGAVLVTTSQLKVLDAAWKVVHTYPLPAHDANAVVFYRA